MNIDVTARSGDVKLVLPIAERPFFGFMMSLHSKHCSWSRFIQQGDVEDQMLYILVLVFLLRNLKSLWLGISVTLTP
jgi:hypothetical protein